MMCVCGGYRMTGTDTCLKRRCMQCITQKRTIPDRKVTVQKYSAGLGVPIHCLALSGAPKLLEGQYKLLKKEK